MTIQYLIDSENVGDFWIPLLELPAQDTELIVFYTRNSPHMSYDSLIRLKESDRTVTFIKCYDPAGFRAGIPHQQRRGRKFYYRDKRYRL